MKTQGIRLAERSDLPLLTETLTQSFSDDPVINWFIRQDEHREEAIRDNMRFILDWFYPAGGVYTSEDCGACSIWIPQGYVEGQLTEEERRRLDKRKASWTTEEGLWRLDLLIKLEEEKKPSYPHWELGYIGVRPELQGKGVGSALLEHMLTRLDEINVPAYLESSNPVNQPLYERHGFRVIDSIPLPDGPTMMCMLRNPKVPLSDAYISKSYVN